MVADAITREHWRISEELGQPVPEHVKVRETVRDELGHTEMPLPKVLSTAEYVHKWEAGKPTPNPHYIDAAMLLCAEAGVAPTETMLVKFSEASRLRLTGSPAGTADKVRKESLLDACLLLMANLIASDVPLHLAARKAQSWQQKAAPESKCYKASSLERYYSDRIRRTGVEDRIKKARRCHPAEVHEQWRNLAESLPESPDYESGHRR